jgi:hypothetical protein
MPEAGSNFNPLPIFDGLILNIQRYLEAKVSPFWVLKKIDHFSKV